MSTKKVGTVQNNFGIDLQRVRKLRGYSVDKLAKLLNISTSYIYKIEGMAVTEVAKRTADQLQYWIESNFNEKGVPSNQTANGTHNNQLQVNGGSHNKIDFQRSSVVHEPVPEYNDPIAQLFLKDWLTLSDVVKMRVWTLVKEELEKMK